MGCNSHTISGLAGNCEPSMGGVLEVYINHKDNVSKVEVSGSKITDIALASTESADKFQVYQFKRNTANATQTYSIDPANGVNFVTTDLNLAFSKQDTQKRVEIITLALDDLAVIYKDANQKYWYMGKDEPVQASAAGGETGTARTDGNKYTITLQDNSLELPFEVEESIIAPILNR